MDVQYQAMLRQLDEIRAQRRTMRTQSIAAVSEARSTREGLIETRKLVAQNEQALKAAQDSVDAVEKTAIYSQRAYLSAKMEGKTERIYVPSDN